MTNSAFQGGGSAQQYLTALAHTRQDKFNIYKKNSLVQVVKNTYPCSKQLQND